VQALVHVMGGIPGQLVITRHDQVVVRDESLHCDVTRSGRDLPQGVRGLERQNYALLLKLIPSRVLQYCLGATYGVCTICNRFYGVCTICNR